MRTVLNVEEIGLSPMNKCYKITGWAQVTYPIDTLISAESPDIAYNMLRNILEKNGDMNNSDLQVVEIDSPAPPLCEDGHTFMHVARRDSACYKCGQREVINEGG